MNPTLNNGDTVAISSLKRSFDYGDIVIVAQPNAMHKTLIKRVIAVGGQTVDVESEGKPGMTKEKLDFIYRLKTSALIEGAMLTGAVLAGATQGEQKIIEQTAGEVGLAFQIQDDILDVTSTMEVLGKPIGSDEKNHKITYVTYEGIEKAKADVASLSEQAIARMDSLVVKNEYLTELLRYLILREK